MNTAATIENFKEKFDSMIAGVESASSLTAVQKEYIIEMLQDQKNIEIGTAIMFGDQE